MQVTKHGRYLGGALWVKFDGTKATFTVPSATRSSRSSRSPRTPARSRSRPAAASLTPSPRFVLTGPAALYPTERGGPAARGPAARRRGINPALPAADIRAGAHAGRLPRGRRRTRVRAGRARPPGVIAYSDADGSLYLASLSGTNAKTLVEPTRRRASSRSRSRPTASRCSRSSTATRSSSCSCPRPAATRSASPAPTAPTPARSRPTARRSLLGQRVLVERPRSRDLHRAPSPAGRRSGSSRRRATTRTRLAQYSPDGTKLAFMRDESTARATRRSRSSSSPRPAARRSRSRPT